MFENVSVLSFANTRKVKGSHTMLRGANSFLSHSSCHHVTVIDARITGRWGNSICRCGEQIIVFAWRAAWPNCLFWVRISAGFGYIAAPAASQGECLSKQIRRSDSYAKRGFVGRGRWAMILWLLRRFPADSSLEAFSTVSVDNVAYVFRPNRPRVSWP